MATPATDNAVTLRTAVNALLSAMKLPTSSNTSACAFILAATDFMVADRVVREQELATQSFTSLAERQNGIVPMEVEGGIGTTGNAYGFPPLEGTPLSDELMNTISMDGSFNAGVIH
jgi:hypothetical protein